MCYKSGKFKQRHETTCQPPTNKYDDSPHNNTPNACYQPEPYLTAIRGDPRNMQQMYDSVDNC